MISKQKNLNGICYEVEKIENYDEAVADTKNMWDCHHRLETHFSDGTPRPKNAFLSKDELIALGAYWHRPANELIFLTKKYHNKLHRSNIKTREKISKSLTKVKGEWSYKPRATKHLQRCWKEYTNLYEEILYKSEEHKRRSESMKGRTFSKETKKKMSESHSEASIGKHWYTNGIIDKFCFKCPKGFKPGRHNRNWKNQYTK